MKLPFTGKNEHELAKKMKTGEYQEIEEPEELRALLRKLLKVNPDERINYSEIKELTFLK